MVDVGNAVFEQSDCTMLSGEAGNGDFPVLSLETMANILKQTESFLNYEEKFA